MGGGLGGWDGGEEGGAASRSHPSDSSKGTSETSATFVCGTSTTSEAGEMGGGGRGWNGQKEAATTSSAHSARSSESELSLPPLASRTSGTSVTITPGASTDSGSQGPIGASETSLGPGPLAGESSEGVEKLTLAFERSGGRSDGSGVGSLSSFENASEVWRGWGEVETPTVYANGPKAEEGEEEEELSHAWPADGGALTGGLVRSQLRLAGRRRAGGTLLMVRCGERLDRVFPGWTRRGFGADGAYQPYDLNMPEVVPRRRGGPLGFVDDGPVTRLGRWGAEGLGQALGERGLRPALVLSSPALRCVETAAALCSHLPSHPPLCLEPGLFEPLGWYQREPGHLDAGELRRCGYPASLAYRPAMEGLPLGLVGRETEAEAATRVAQVLRLVLEAVGGTVDWASDPLVLVVAHAFTLDAALRQLDPSAAPKPYPRSAYLGLAYPYLCQLVFRRHPGPPVSWHLMTLPSAQPLPHLHYAFFSSLPTPALAQLRST